MNSGQTFPSDKIHGRSQIRSSCRIWYRRSCMVSYKCLDGILMAFWSDVWLVKYKNSHHLSNGEVTARDCQNCFRMLPLKGHIYSQLLYLARVRMGKMDISATVPYPTVCFSRQNHKPNEEVTLCLSRLAHLLEMDLVHECSLECTRRLSTCQISNLSV